MTEVEEQYTKLKEIIAFLSGPIGYETNISNPTFIDQAKNGLRELRDKMMVEKVKNNSVAYNLATQLEEYKSFKDIIPQDSKDSIIVIDDKITTISTELQSIVDYSPELYYELYFLLNGNSQKSLVESNFNGSGLYNFKTWFMGSKVVDSNNEPLQVYHGTGSNDFTRFKFDVFPGIYFAENKSYSDYFKNNRGNDGLMYLCYLRILNPLDLRVFKTDLVKYEDFIIYIKLKYGYDLPENKMLKAGSDSNNGLWAWQYLRGGADWLKFIRDDRLFDGITFYENNPADKDANGNENVTPAWMIFKEEQVKNVIGNMTYSLESKDIRFNKGGEL
jgi:hypothetical protein